MTRYHADPEWRAWWLLRIKRGPLRIGISRRKTTAAQRALYQKLRKCGIGRDEAVREAYGGIR